MSDLSGEDALVQALQVATESAMSEINTTLPGVVVSVSADGSRAVVKPSMPKALASGEALEAPQIVQVPVVWPRAQGGKIGMTMPLRPGDGVTLHFAQRSLEGWLSGQAESLPDDPRRFDLSDAIAVPGLAPFGATAHSDEVELFFGPVRLRMKPDGSGVLETAGGNLTITPDGIATFTGPKLVVKGDVECEGDVRAGNISLRNHKHNNVQPGGGISGISVP